MSPPLLALVILCCIRASTAHLDAIQTEKQHHRTIYEKNMRLIAWSNTQNLGYALGVNEYTDQEDPDQPLGFEVESRSVRRMLGTYEIPNATLPAKKNWCDQGKCQRQTFDQLSCNASSAFAAAYTYDIYRRIAGQTTVVMAVQYLLSCTPAPSCSLPNSITIEDSLWLLTNFGMPNNYTYPYPNQPNKSYTKICTGSENYYKIDNLTYFSYNDLDNTKMRQLINRGPVISYIYRDTNFTNYKSGVFQCSGTPTVQQLNHAVTVVGFDPFGNYIIKNSLGDLWGINGFGYISKNSDCGITLKVYQLLGALQLVWTAASLTILGFLFL